MTPLVLLVGLLGSGKTTLLRRLLPLLVARGTKPVVVINDYQNARVDAATLAEFVSEIRAISGSCVCCGSREELVATLAALPLTEKSLVLVETNGTTDADQLIELLSLDPQLRHYTLPVQISVVDAQRWQKRLAFWQHPLEREQVRTATHLHLTRNQDLPPARLEKVLHSLAETNPGARPLTEENLAETLVRLREDAAARPHRHACACGHEHHDHDHHDHNHDDQEHSHDHAAEHHFASCELPLPPRLTRSALDAFLADLPPEVLRAKGLAYLEDTPADGFSTFQWVGEYRTTLVSHHRGVPNVPPVVLLIGSHLPEASLKSALARLQ